MVTVHTSNRKFAGTDASVYFSLIGDLRESKRVYTPSSTENYQSGKKDVFKATFEDVGTLKQLRIGHNNTGLGPGWHLSKVIIV